MKREPARARKRRERELTDREKQILRLLAEGLTSKQIADALSIAVNTVSNHRKSICKKLGLHSTAQLIAYAVTAQQTF